MQNTLRLAYAVQPRRAACNNVERYLKNKENEMQICCAGKGLTTANLFGTI